MASIANCYKLPEGKTYEHGTHWWKHIDFQHKPNTQSDSTCLTFAIQNMTWLYHEPPVICHMGKPPKHGMGFSQHFVVPQNMESAQPKWTSMCQNPRTYNILQHYLIVRKSSGKTKGLVYLKKTRLQIFFVFLKGIFPWIFPILQLWSLSWWLGYPPRPFSPRQGPVPGWCHGKPRKMHWGPRPMT